MDRLRKLFKSKKFIFIFSMIVTMIFNIFFRISIFESIFPYEICVYPILSLLWGPVALLGSIIFDAIFLTLVWPENSLFNFILLALLFICNFAVWKLWYSILNKNGWELPNLNNFYNLIKILAIFLIYSIIMVFLFYGFGRMGICNVGETAIDGPPYSYLIQTVSISILIAILSLYIVNYLNIPIFSPQKQFKELLPKKAYTLSFILFLLIGTYMVFFMNNEYSLTLGLIEVVLIAIYLLKPYEEDVFKIKNALRINLFNKILVALFLIIAIVIFFTTFIDAFGNYVLWGVFISDYFYIAYDFLFMMPIPIIIYGYIIEKTLTMPIGRLSEIISRKISNREDFLLHKRNLNSINVNNELKILIDSLLAMENDMIDYGQKLIKVTSENERYATELKLASDIQNSMVPKNFEEFCNFVNANNANEVEFHKNTYDLKLWGFMEAKLEVGGDFYDYFRIDDDNIGFVIGDVSGKGITAALVMVKAMTLIQDYAKQYDDLSKVFYEVNNLLCEDNAEELFVTSWLGRLNLRTGELSFVNAGHNPPLIRLNNEDVDLADGMYSENKGYASEFEYMSMSPGLVLAAMEDMPYKTHTINLGKNDTLFLYTDGVTEANNDYEGFYGEERLKNILNQHKDEDLSIILDTIEEDILEFCNHQSLFDDTTMLIIRLE